MLHRTRNKFRKRPEWAPPIGHIDAGETPRQAAKRELREELGIEVEEEDLRLVHVLYRPKHDQTGARVDYFFDTERFTGEVTNAEPRVHDELRWFAPDRLPRNVIPHVRHAYDSVMMGKFESELDLDWLREHGYVITQTEGSSA